MLFSVSPFRGHRAVSLWLVLTALALLLTGCIIHEIGLRSLRLTPTLGVMMVFRFVISPALGAALCALLGIKNVYVLK